MEKEWLNTNSQTNLVADSSEIRRNKILNCSEEQAIRSCNLLLGSWQEIVSNGNLGKMVVEQWMTYPDLKQTNTILLPKQTDQWIENTRIFHKQRDFKKWMIKPTYNNKQPQLRCIRPPVDKLKTGQNSLRIAGSTKRKINAYWPIS